MFREMFEIFYIYSSELLFSVSCDYFELQQKKISIGINVFYNKFSQRSLL